jgi:hypothetical protein
MFKERVVGLKRIARSSGLIFSGNINITAKSYADLFNFSDILLLGHPNVMRPSFGELAEGRLSSVSGGFQDSGFPTKCATRLRNILFKGQRDQVQLLRKYPTAQLSPLRHLTDCLARVLARSSLGDH